jgi:hypothetical protein
VIPPVTKDWTWVLDRPCPECGYDARTLTDDDVAPAVRENTAVWRAVVADTARADPSTWSPLGYACHVRELHRLDAQRLQLMLTQDDPLYPDWDQDETAVAERYGEQDTAEVADQLEHAGRELDDAFAAPTPEQWRRPGRRSDGASFTVSTFARYYLHDLVHHRHDVGA